MELFLLVLPLISFGCVVPVPTLPMRLLPMTNRPRWWCIGRWWQPQRNAGTGPGRTLGVCRADKRNADTNTKDCRNKSLMHGMNARTPTARGRRLNPAI